MDYYCLIAGLPDIGIDDSRPAFDTLTFKESVYPQIAANDKRLIDLFYQKFDNRNLLNYLKDRELHFDMRGNLTKEEMEECFRLSEEGETVRNKHFPSYFREFAEEYKTRRDEDETVKWEDRLAGLYYQMAIHCGNAVISGWFEFNLNLNNILAAHAARKYNMRAEAVGDNEIAQSIRETAGQRTPSLAGLANNIEEWQRIAEEPDWMEREKKIDLLKWQWLDEAIFFKYFTIERIFAYLVRLEIVERRTTLNREEGKRIFGALIERLKDEANEIKSNPL
ncbi:MAG: DUF2764 domain-containing protein [Bacteroidales bacterium]|nr:DUF2764 domain-containing protein [Bacteroidales bacterium]